MARSASAASAASAQSASPSGPSVCLEQPEEVETEAKGFWLMVMTVTDRFARNHMAFGS